MALVDYRNHFDRVPDGYTVIPVSAAQKSASLRICVLVKKAPDQVGGRLVVLRENLDSRVYLGAVTDAGGAVHLWVEVWIQTVAGVHGTASTCRETMTNAILDDRWRRLADALKGLSEDSLIETGSEFEHPPPVYLDPTAEAPVHPVGKDTGAPWRLCEDDALLAQNGLPSYTGSLHRYLYVSGGEGKTAFVALTPDAPAPTCVVPQQDAIDGLSGLIPLNPEAGLMTVRPYHTLSLREHLAVLGGGEWSGICHGVGVMDTEQAATRLGHVNNPGRLFLEADGRNGRLVEGLHLKVCLLTEMIRIVHGLVQRQQRPLLNLGAESFRIRFASAGSGLPFLWTARVMPTDPGGSVVLPIKLSDARCFVPARQQEMSVYRPAEAGIAARGRGMIRIRQVLEQGRKGTIVEGTFQTREDLPISPHDLVWFRISLGDGPIDLYAVLEEDKGLARDECRFRSVGQALPPAVAARLKAAEGIPLPNVAFELLPMVSTPYDLYALAVLGIEIFLVNKQTKLSFALDELFSLAREAGSDSAEGELPQRIGALFQADQRWAKSLGPHRLVEQELTPEEAFSAVPAPIWFELLAAIVRMLPGISRDSVCHDYGDAPPKALHEVFARGISDLERLLVRTRGLVVTDWGQNREIRNVIRRAMEQTNDGISEGRGGGKGR